MFYFLFYHCTNFFLIKFTKILIFFTKLIIFFLLYKFDIFFLLKYLFRPYEVSRLYTSSAQRKLSSLSRIYFLCSVHEPKTEKYMRLMREQKLCCMYYYVIFSFSLTLSLFSLFHLFCSCLQQVGDLVVWVDWWKLKKMHQQSCALRNNIQIYEKCNKRSFENSSARLWVIMKFYHLPWWIAFGGIDVGVVEVWMFNVF